MDESITVNDTLSVVCSVKEIGGNGCSGSILYDLISAALASCNNLKVVKAVRRVRSGGTYE